MTYNNNAFDCAVEIMHFINDNIATYQQLEDNYIEVLGDYENANRCFYNRLALIYMSDDIDAIIHHAYVTYHIDVAALLNCPSFVWELQRRIAKHIDYINSWGYDYVMRSSASLRYQLSTYEMLYGVITSICKKREVYC